MDAPIVWWGLLAGGALGGLVRLALQARVDLPYVYRDAATGRLVIVPGVAGHLVIAPLVPFLVLAPAAGLGHLQGGFDAAGFWNAVAISVLPGLLAAEVVEALTRSGLDQLQSDLLDRAREVQ